MGTEQNIYKYVIADYFRDFRRDLWNKKNVLLLCCIYYISFASTGSTFHIVSPLKNQIIGVSVLIAVLNGSFHKVSLPFMMYLVPYSKRQREEYIQKMLYVKILFPLILGCLLDMVAACFGSVSCYTVILQMSGIFFISYICGILCDGSQNFYDSEKRAVYGELRIFTVAFSVICYIAGTALAVICTDSISKTEFWVIFSVMLALFLPITGKIHKHWKTIRSNFAVYEMTIKTER